MNQSLLRFFFRTTTDLQNGSWVQLWTATFGDYDSWLPSLHVLMADELFWANGISHVMSKIDIKLLTERFRANDLKMFNNEGKSEDSLIAGGTWNVLNLH